MDRLQFDVKIDAIESVGSNFAKAKVHILYTGINRNNSFISLEAVERALPSLYYIPVVGEIFKKDDGTTIFGGHGGELVIEDGEINVVNTTMPYGCVASQEDANIRWEDVLDNSGNVRSYLTADIFLWTHRFPELQSVVQNDSWQSMEISILKGQFKKINGQPTYDIEDFKFDALCILGKDKDPYYNVEPCFEGSDIKVYSLFKQQFSLMVAELQQELSGTSNLQIPHAIKNNVSIGLKLRAETSNKGSVVGYRTAQYLLNNDQITQDKFNKLKIYFSKVNVDEIQPGTSEYVTFMLNGGKDAFAWTNSSVVMGECPEHTSNNDFAKKEDVSMEENKTMEAELENPNTSYAEDVESKEEEKETSEEENAEEKEEFVENESSGEDFEVKYQEACKSYEDLKVEYESLKSQFDDMETQMNSLKTYKLEKENAEKQARLESVFADFSKVLSADEICAFREKSDSITVEELVKEMKVFAFDKGRSFNQPKEEDNKVVTFGLGTEIGDVKPTKTNVWDRAKSEI